VLLNQHRPLLTLSLLDATDEVEVTRVFQKLSSVCQQFLDWPLDFESAVRACPQVCEHLVLFYRPNRDKAQIATASQWTVITDFIAAAKLAQDSAVRAQLAIAAEAESAGETARAANVEATTSSLETESVREMAMETAVLRAGAVDCGCDCSRVRR